MCKIKVSVIIPVYNAALNLEQCICSILKQTLQEVEVIIVNDGSTDDSLAIIRKFEKQDNKVVVIDSANEGVSAARNKGLTIAKGEYIGFVDADDRIEPDMYKSLYKKVKDAYADMAICNVNVMDENKDHSVRLSLQEKIINVAENRHEELTQLMRFTYDFANWNKMYSNDIIKQHGILFDETMRVWEDLLFNLCYFQYSGRIITTSECLYNYRIHESSVMNIHKHDVVHEYNRLFGNFNDYCLQHGFLQMQDVFNAEMRRGFYYAIIPQLLRQLKGRRLFFLATVRLFRVELIKANTSLFHFQRDELKGIQGIKKRLLSNGSYRLFSLVVNLKGLIRLPE